MTNSSVCAHNCRNICAILVEALSHESELAKLYTDAVLVCDDPETNKFLIELKDSRDGIVEKIMQKLNEMRARAEIDDSINLTM